VSEHRIAFDDLSVFCEPNEDGFHIGVVDGLNHYPDRAQVLPYKAVYLMDGDVSDMLEHQAYLRALGVGTQELRFVKGKNLFDGLLTNREEMERLMFEMQTNEELTIDAFTGASPDWKNMVEALLLDPGRVRTPSWEVARMLDDKELFRRLGGDLEREHYFPDHTFVHGQSAALREIMAMRLRHRSVVIKRPDLESGVGAYRVNGLYSLSGLPAFLKQYGRGSRPLIVEQWVDGEEVIIASLQWYFAPGREPQRRFMSRQYCDGMIHEGNVIGSRDTDVFPETWSLTLRENVVEQAWEMTKLFVQHVQGTYVGPAGFDFMVVRNGTNGFRVYLLECNARKTAGTYLESVRWQVQTSGRIPAACAAMRNCHPVSARHWREVVTLLQSKDADEFGHLAMNPDTGLGVMVALPRCLRLKQPKCLLIAIAEKIEHAEWFLNAAKKRLERTRLE